jgi:hypothetical protein
MGFADERELIDRALAHGDSADEGDAEFPPVARRFAAARQARRLTIEEVAVQWGHPPSKYWDLEFHDDEAFSVVSVGELVILGEILRVPVMQLLFGEDPPPEVPRVTFSEVARRLHSVMRERAISADELGELAGWDLAEYLENPDKLADLPVFGLRRICEVAGVDWAAVLANVAKHVR